MMRTMREPGGKRDQLLAEAAFNQLRAHAPEYARELIAAFTSETELGLRSWLIELIGASRSIEAIPVLAECLGDPELRDVATRALDVIAATPHEARMLLWQAGLHPHQRETDQTGDNYSHD